MTLVGFTATMHIDDFDQKVAELLEEDEYYGHSSSIESIRCEVIQDEIGYAGITVEDAS